MNTLLLNLTSGPLFGVTLTIGLYALASSLYQRRRSQLFNPLILTAITIMVFLQWQRIPVERYSKGADIITFWLGPAAVALAVPLHRQLQSWRRHLPAILGAVFMGSLLGLSVAPLVAVWLGADRSLVQALVPRSVTTPIAVELAKVLAAVPELAAGFVIVTGIFGHVFGPRILTAVGVRNPLARGLAVGVAAHGIGTARMLAESEQEGAASGMGMSLAGLVTGILVGTYATWMLRG